MAGSLGLAYHIPAASITVSLGGKFQMLKFYCSRVKTNIKNPFTLDPEIFNDLYFDKYIADRQSDYFYGLTFSVTYNFTI